MEHCSAWLQAYLAHLMQGDGGADRADDVRTAGGAALSCLALPSKLSTHACDGAIKSLRSASLIVPLKPMMLQKIGARLRRRMCGEKGGKYYSTDTQSCEYELVGNFSSSNTFRRPSVQAL